MSRARRPFHRVSARLDRICLGLESRIGLTATAALVGLAWLLLAAVYVTPSIDPYGYGPHYCTLSEDPFSLKTPCGYRFLSPLLGYLLFLRGKLFVIFPLILAVAFMGAIYRLYRTKSYTPFESMGMVGLMAMSSPILFLLHFPGFTDTTTYLLLILAVVSVKRAFWFTVCFTLALLNHPTSFFAIFWLLWLSIIAGRTKKYFWRNLLGAGVSVAIMVTIHSIMTSTVGAKPANLTIDHYLDPALIWENTRSISRLLPVGMFQGFKLLWILPILAAWRWFVVGRYARCFLYVIIIISAALQMMFAYDTSRLMGMAFPAVLFAAHDLRKSWPRATFAPRIWFLIAITCLIPQFYIGRRVHVFLPLPYSLMSLFMGNDPFSPW